jgi:hypothetical protein
VLARRDRGHLEKILAAMGADYPIVDYSQRICPPGMKPPGKVIDMSRLVISSKALTDDLRLLGFDLIKAHRQGPPDLDCSLIRHFWRGVIDGDGSISSYIDKRDESCCWLVHLTGTRIMVDAFSQFVTSSTGFKPRTARLAGRSLVAWTIKYGGLKAPQAIARLLYDNSTISLERKRVKAEQLIAQKPSIGNRFLASAGTLNKLHEELGTWDKVAARLGVRVRAVYFRRNRLGET